MRMFNALNFFSSSSSSLTSAINPEAEEEVQKNSSNEKVDSYEFKRAQVEYLKECLFKRDFETFNHEYQKMSGYDQEELCSKLWEACVERGETSDIQLLLDLDFDINQIMGGHETPLHKAIWNKNYHVAEFLLKAGANPNICGTWSYFYATGTPLHIAIRQSDFQLVKLMIKYGANINARNEWGETPLHLAAYYRVKAKIVKELIDHGADMHRINGLNSHAESGSPLHVAAGKNAEKILRVFLEEGASVDLRNERGETPLMSAAKKGSFECVQLLLKYNADVTLVNELGETALDLADQFEGSAQNKIKKILLEHLEY